MASLRPILFLAIALLGTDFLFAQQSTEILNLDTSRFPLIEFTVQFPNRNEVKRYVNNSNTHVTESGTPQPFTIDCPIDQISFAIILDKSISMSFKPNDRSLFPQPDPDSARWRSAKSAIKTFASSLTPPDSACLISFSRIPTLGQDFTHEADLIAQAVDSITLEYYTGTWFACQMGIDLLKARPGRRVIILLNDGGENVRKDYGGPSHVDIINMALQNDVVIHSIGLGEFSGTNTLQYISAQTGGRYYLSADGSDLTNIYYDIISSITSSPCTVTYETEEFCPNGSKRTIEISTTVNSDTFTADTAYYSPFNLESTTITTSNPNLVYPNEEFSVQMEFETFLRPDEPTIFNASFRFDNEAVDFLRIESDSGIFVEEPPTAAASEAGILQINGHTSVFSPDNKYLFTLFFKAKELKSARIVSFEWQNIDIVRKCNTVSDAKLFSFSVDGLCDKIVRRKTQPSLQSVYPNPTSSRVVLDLRFEAVNLEPTKVDLTTQSGSVVATLFNGLPGVGEMSIAYDTENLPAGTYWIVLRKGLSIETAKLIVAH